ncbi:MAG: response regulator [Bacillaceae bacterium]|nr:response regulator [Bacillaceae bacterium]
MIQEKLCKVIIVDDELLIREGIKHYLNWEQEGFEIVGEASNGKETLELIATTNPHVVITDIVMPIMDGKELTKIVKEKYPNIQVIILSSFGEFDYVRSTFQSGVVDYILKPKLDGKLLLDALRKAVSRIPNFKLEQRETDNELSIEKLVHKAIFNNEEGLDLTPLSIHFSKDLFCFLGIHVDTSVDKQKVIVEMKNYLGNTKSHYFIAEKNLIVFLINLENNEMSKVSSLAEQLCESEKGATLAISKTFSNVRDLATIYKTDFLKLTQYMFYFPEKRVLTRKDLPIPLIECEQFDLNRFIDEFKRERFSSAFSYLDEHVLTYSTCYTTDVYEFKSFF